MSYDQSRINSSRPKKNKLLKGNLNSGIKPAKDIL